MNRRLLWAVGISVVLSGGMGLAEGGVVARIGDSGEFVELSHQVEGRSTVELLPLHRAGWL